MKFAVVGGGKVGTALGVLLQRAGHRIVGVSGGETTAERASRFLPEVPFLQPAEAARRAQATILATPDDRIAEVCEDLAREGAIRPGSFVAHLSGIRSLQDLAAAEAAGGEVLSVHPLQSFPSVEAGLERMAGSGMAVTARTDAGFGVGRQIATDVGARPFRMTDEMKPLYHAAAVFGSNYVVAVMSEAEALMREAGMEDPLPNAVALSRGVLENVAALGPESALTGPIARGDARTVALHLEALKQHRAGAVAAYVALAGLVLDLAERSGGLQSTERAAVEEVLDRWR